MRAKSLRSVLDNYSVLQELGEIVLDGNVNPDVRARVIGVQVKMESFEFFFGISVGKTIFQLLFKAVQSLQQKANT